MQDDTDQAILYAVTAIINVMEWHTGNLARIKMWCEEEVARIRQEEAAFREAAIEIRVQEMSREVLAKAEHDRNLANAFESSLVLALAEIDGLKNALAEANEKIERIERANKFEGVQVALGRGKKAKRVKAKGFEDYE